MGERVVRLTSGLKPYTQRSVVGVGFAVREAGVDGRARAMYLKTDLRKSVMDSQILTTPAWTRSVVIREESLFCHNTAINLKWCRLVY